VMRVIITTIKKKWMAVKCEWCKMMMRGLRIVRGVGGRGGDMRYHYTREYPRVRAALVPRKKRGCAGPLSRLASRARASGAKDRSIFEDEISQSQYYLLRV
jgi:hypothetical protein